MSDDSKYLAEKLLKVRAVDAQNVEIGKEYTFIGLITKILSEELPLPRIMINKNIYATLQGVDEGTWDYLKGHSNQSMFFHCVIVDVNEDGSLETECKKIGTGIPDRDLEEDSNE